MQACFWHHRADGKELIYDEDKYAIERHEDAQRPPGEWAIGARMARKQIDRQREGSIARPDIGEPHACARHQLGPGCIPRRHEQYKHGIGDAAKYGSQYECPENFKIPRIIRKIKRVGHWQ